jgi:hypothetical protein
MATLQVRLSDEDKSALEELATDCGYDNLSAFVRAIARRESRLAEDSNLAKRIDKLVNRVNELQAQQQRDHDQFTDNFLMMDKRINRLESD